MIFTLWILAAAADVAETPSQSERRWKLRQRRRMWPDERVGGGYVDCDDGQDSDVV